MISDPSPRTTQWNPIDSNPLLAYTYWTDSCQTKVITFYPIRYTFREWLPKTSSFLPHPTWLALCSLLIWTSVWWNLLPYPWERSVLPKFLSSASPGAHSITGVSSRARWRCIISHNSRLALASFSHVFFSPVGREQEKEEGLSKGFPKDHCFEI